MRSILTFPERLEKMSTIVAISRDVGKVMYLQASSYM